MFNGFLKSITGKQGTWQDGPEKAVISVARYDSLIENPEAYTLEVTADAIIIGAGEEAGLFYAFQTLMQLIYPSREAVSGTISIPCVKISDSPHYRWRGMHLDVSRHFFPKEFIFRMLDAMAMHKLNTFHWHLTDDQGWRIEIDSTLSWPLLLHGGVRR
jgi:hexosaminidase